MALEVKPIVLHALRSNLTDCAAKFNDNQRPEQWTALEQAMWALQFAQQRSEQELAKLTETWSIPSFPERFATAAKANRTATAESSRIRVATTK